MHSFYCLQIHYIWYILYVISGTFIYVQSPELDNDAFLTDFRLKFRLPYDLFQSLVNSLMDHDLFQQWRGGNADCTGIKSTPLELLLLGSLRILGRDSMMDCMAAEIKVSFATFHSFFHKFIKYGATFLFEQHINHPTVKESFYENMIGYAHMGLHGAVGSMDATHISSVRIPASLSQAHTSFKNNKPSRSYNICVNRK